MISKENDVEEKNYYKENKDRLLEKINCECGIIVGKCNYNRHLKSTIHMCYLKDIEIEKYKNKYKKYKKKYNELKKI